MRDSWIVNCELLYKIQSKESQEREYAMNNIITRDHTLQPHVLAIANIHIFSISYVLDLPACMYGQLLTILSMVVAHPT